MHKCSRSRWGTIRYVTTIKGFPFKIVQIYNHNLHIFHCMKISFSECYTEVGIDYWWYDQTETTNQATIDDCRKYCRETCGECKYFTHINDGRCHCKTSKAGRTDKHKFGDSITSGGLCNVCAHQGRVEQGKYKWRRTADVDAVWRCTDDEPNDSWWVNCDDCCYQP